MKFPRYVPISLLQAAVGLLCLGLVTVLQQYIHHLSSGFQFDFSWLLVSLRTGTEILGLLLVIPGLSWIIRPFFAKKKNQFLNGIRLFAGVASIAILHRLFSVVLFEILYGADFSVFYNLFRPQVGRMLWPGMFSSLVQVSILSSIIWGKSYYDQYLKQQQVLALAELKALKMQLHPHFLFNTFHSISAMIDIKPADAQLMLSRLSFLLRTLLEKEQAEQVTLQEEVEFIRHYLGIEEVRFQDRLRVDYVIHPDTLLARVPSLMLLPLVENALKHGISQVLENGRVEIGSEKIGLKTLKIWVEDNGPGTSEGKEGFGIGLTNVKQRLEQLYGDNFLFEATPLSNKGYRITVLIPLEIINEPFNVYKHADH